MDSDVVCGVTSLFSRLFPRFPFALAVVAWAIRVRLAIPSGVAEKTARSYSIVEARTARM